MPPVSPKYFNDLVVRLEVKNASCGDAPPHLYSAAEK
jgi:hypothetical protein